MIVVDSAIWIDHLHAGIPLLGELLLREQALMHPHVLAEIALRSIRNQENWTDAHLLASAFLSPGGKLWTRDKKLQVQSEQLGVAHEH